MFDQILKLYREQHHCNQSDLAALLDISRTYLSQLERRVSTNISFSLAQRILALCGHYQVEVIIPHKIWVDVEIAPEILLLNLSGVVTEGCCVGPPATAMIRPSSAEVAKAMGYEPVYNEQTDLFCIVLRYECVTETQTNDQ